MEAPIIVAIVAGVVSVATAGFAAVSSWRLKRLESEFTSEQVLLKHELDEEVTARRRAEAASDLVSRYRDPLLRAANDLQSRLYHIVAQDFLGTYYYHFDEDIREYARENTLYVLADYLGWSEIVRREIQFLDVGDEQVAHELSERLDTVSSTLLTDKLPPAFRIFRGEQRAIGEIVTVPRSQDTGIGPRSETLGYAAFVARRAEQPFAKWFRRLSVDVDTYAERGSGKPRLITLQRSLIDVIDLLDPNCIRISKKRRTKLDA